MAKPSNAGTVDPYGLKKKELQSQTLPQTDYSSFAPIKKSKVDLNNLDHVQDARNPVKPRTDLQEEKPTQSYSNTKAMLSSQWADSSNYAAPPKAAPEAVSTPVVAKNAS